MMRFPFYVFAIAVSALPGVAQEAAETPNAQKFIELAAEEGERYDFALAGQKLKLRAEPVLKWSNPIAGEIYGGVFVWTLQGRPKLVGSFYKWYHPFTHGTHEFVSLAEGALIGNRDGRPVWEPSEPGIKFQPIAGAPVVAGTPTARLTQMRLLAKQFDVEMTDKDGTVRRLRLLNQPLYRYKLAKADSGDGALFAFANGTDPETLLLIESKKQTWQYAFTRLNATAMKASRSKSTAWEVPPLSSQQAYRSHETYRKFQFD
ncbi:MAG: hypothetical protein AB8B91_11465 [Rubripirellula sp.]